MMSQPTVSVIIPSYNGANKVGVLLTALTKQTSPPTEVIVVSDGSTDDTAKVVHSFDKSLSKLRLVEITNKGRAAARNIGAEMSMGNVLIFYDDDMEPAPNSIAQHIEVHSSYSENILLTGNTAEMYSPSKTDIQNYKASRVQVWMEKYISRLNPIHAENFFFTSANCSMTRALFNRLDGFDKRLTDAEDQDLALRALAEGVPVFFDKLNEAAHHDGITCWSYIERIQAYRRAHLKLLELHSEYKILSSKGTSGWKKLVYSILAEPKYVRMIDQNQLLWLPRAIRYRLYNMVIHGLTEIYPERMK